MKNYYLKDFQAWKVFILFAILRISLVLAMSLDALGQGEFTDPSDAAKIVALMLINFAKSLIIVFAGVYAAKLFLQVSGGIKVTLGDSDK